MPDSHTKKGLLLDPSRTFIPLDILKQSVDVRWHLHALIWTASHAAL